MAPGRKSKENASGGHWTAPYKHNETKSLMRPEAGTQAQFDKNKRARTYRYDSSFIQAHAVQ